MHIFEETQRFRQPWLWILMAFVAAVSIGPMGAGVYHQLVLHRTFGDHPLSDPALLISTVATFLVVGSIVWLLLAAYLRVEVRTEGLVIRFFPFIAGRMIAYSEICNCASRTYNPILEYGGWGIRFGRNGKALNVSGNRGVQLELRSGEKLLLGSQRADELAAAIEGMRRG